MTTTQDIIARAIAEGFILRCGFTDIGEANKMAESVMRSGIVAMELHRGTEGLGVQRTDDLVLACVRNTDTGATQWDAFRAWEITSPALPLGANVKVLGWCDFPPTDLFPAE